MTFDKTAYRRDVLKPLGKDQVRMADLQAAIRAVQTKSKLDLLAALDLTHMFAVPSGETGLAAHFESVKMALNGSQSMSSAKLLKKLLDELGNADLDVTEPKFWDALAQAAVVANKARLTDFAAAVALESQALKVITAEELIDKAQAQGLATSVPEHALVAAVEAAGVAVRPDFPVPTITVPRVIAEVEKHAEYRSLVDVCLLAESGEASSIRVIDKLTYGSGQGTPITASRIEAAQRAAAGGKDSDALQAAQKALTLIRSDFASPASLHELVLATFVSAAKTMLSRGELLASALQKLTAGTGLDPVDAARLLSKFAGSTKAARGLGDVTDLIADGALGDARRTYDAIANPEQFDEAEIKRVAEVLGAAERKKKTLVAKYDAALNARDFTAAAKALTEAATIDKQDQHLLDQLERLPPPAPDSLVIKPAPDGGVALSWRYNGGADSSFIVVRNTDGHAPANPGDGTQLQRDLTALSFTDARPPAGQRVYFSVFSVRRGVQSLPMSADHIVLPQPFDLSATASLTEITVSWRLVPEAVGVQVTQINSDGTRHPVNVRGGTRVTVSGLQTGARYRFQLEAIYALSDGSRLTSPSAAVDASPRGAITAVSDLSVGDARLPDGRDGLRATWTEPPGFSVELWSFPIDEELPRSGSEILLDDMDVRDGKRVNGILDVSGVTAGLNFASLRGLRVVAAVTVDGQRGLLGNSVVVGAAPSVTGPQVERYGDDLLVSWVWPHGDYAASIEWAGSGRTQSQRYTRAQYMINGGFRLSNAADIERVSIATVAFGNGAEWVASPVEVHLAARIPTIRYELDIPPVRFGRRKPARVIVHSAGYVGSLTLLVVARTNTIMPSHPTDGDVISRLDLSLDGRIPAEVEFAIPKLPSPFWIRLFTADGTQVKLADPPTTQLKG